MEHEETQPTAKKGKHSKVLERGEWQAQSAELVDLAFRWLVSDAGVRMRRELLYQRGIGLSDITQYGIGFVPGKTPALNGRAVALAFVYPIYDLNGVLSSVFVDPMQGAAHWLEGSHAGIFSLSTLTTWRPIIACKNPLEVFNLAALAEYVQPVAIGGGVKPKFYKDELGTVSGVFVHNADNKPLWLEANTNVLELTNIPRTRNELAQLAAKAQQERRKIRQVEALRYSKKVQMSVVDGMQAAALAYATP